MIFTTSYKIYGLCIALSFKCLAQLCLLFTGRLFHNTDKFHYEGHVYHLHSITISESICLLASVTGNSSGWVWSRAPVFRRSCTFYFQAVRLGYKHLSFENWYGGCSSHKRSNKYYLYQLMCSTVLCINVISFFFISLYKLPSQTPQLTDRY